MISFGKYQKLTENPRKKKRQKDLHWQYYKKFYSAIFNILSMYVCALMYSEAKGEPGIIYQKCTTLWYLFEKYLFNNFASLW